MKHLVAALIALALTAPAAAQDVAPAVKRKPAETSNVPAAPPQGSPAQSAPGTPQPAVRARSEREIQAALTAAAGAGGDSALDSSLIRVMSRLAASGRCGEAAGLAARDGRKELASRVAQYCE